jgi:hypothetical protein
MRSPVVQVQFAVTDVEHGPWGGALSIFDHAGQHVFGTR